MKTESRAQEPAFPETTVDVFSMVAVVVIVGAVSSIAHEWIKRRPGDGNMRREMQALRDEVESLRRQNNEVVLSFDSTIRHVEKRLDHVESRLPLPRGAEAGEEVSLTGERQ